MDAKRTATAILEVLAGMRVDAPASAAAQRTWADRLLAEERRQLLQQAERDQKSGDAIVLMGGRTGRDGIHGATFPARN